MNDDESIGRRIAHYRKSRGMTQLALAQRASISLSLLRKVEQGSREATSGLVAAVAKPLDVDVAALTGQPYDRDGRQPDRIHTLMPTLRRALAYWDLPPETHKPPRDKAQLVADTWKMSRLRQAGRHEQIAEQLPDLLIETSAAAHQADGTDRERYFEILTVLLFAAHSVAYKTGYQDLSIVVEDRLQWTAQQSADPLMGALAAWSRTTSLQRTGAYDAGMQLLDRAQDQIAIGDDQATLYMRGSLHLRAAFLAARAGKIATAKADLDEAQQIAGRIGTDSDGGWHQLSFGPSNAAINDISISIELGDGPRALDRAENLHLSGNVTAVRAGRHHLDLARAYLWQGRHEQALTSLQHARTLAPQQTRHHPVTREVLRMLVRAHRHPSEPLIRFSAWVGTGTNG